jgi:glutathione peroxidase
MIKLIVVTAALLSCTNPTSNINVINVSPTEKTSIHTFKVESLDGSTINFADFKGKKILVVNTAIQRAGSFIPKV